MQAYKSKEIVELFKYFSGEKHNHPSTPLPRRLKDGIFVLKDLESVERCVCLLFQMYRTGLLAELLSETLALFLGAEMGAELLLKTREY